LDDVVQRVERREVDQGPEGETSLQLLQNVYRDRKQPLTVRVRCAVEALVHEYTKKGTDKGTIDGTFAERLERELRAIERSKQTVPLLNPPTIEQLPASELKKPFARPNYRRF
jgi:hypothetical protein